MWSARCMLFMRQTGSRHTILEVCEFRFWQFRDNGDIFSHGRMPILAVSRLHLIDPSSIEHSSACLVSLFRNLLFRLLIYSCSPCGVIRLVCYERYVQNVTNFITHKPVKSWMLKSRTISYLKTLKRTGKRSFDPYFRRPIPIKSYQLQRASPLW